MPLCICGVPESMVSLRLLKRSDGGDVIKAYTAANLQDAHILIGLLHAEGIEARIFNASAQGGLGEIPFVQAYPEIWLVNPSDRDRARRLFEAFEQPGDGATSVRCVSCGEDNPSGFDICWNCQAGLRPTPSGYSGG